MPKRLVIDKIKLLFATFVLKQTFLSDVMY